MDFYHSTIKDLKVFQAIPEWHTGVRWIVKPKVPRSNPTGGNIVAAGIWQLSVLMRKKHSFTK